MSSFKIQHNVSLAPYTTFHVGGPAQHFALVHNSAELLEALKCTLPDTPLWTIGYGSNTLVSDKGLPGMTVCIRGGSIAVTETEIVADAGAWWDDVVQKAIENNLWGIELMSEIPGSVGGSTYINITAYGQSLGPRIKWIEVWDRATSSIKKLLGTELEWGYKTSVFQTEAGKNWIILRVCVGLSKSKTEELQYQKALDVAEELQLDADSLQGRREIITEARDRTGALWRQESIGTNERTAGSFFRNTLVASKLADEIIRFDETGKTPSQIKEMNTVHTGDSKKVSAAHIMLAAGFKRGQRWGDVKLNDKNLLKVEALPGATAQDVYNVMRTIQKQVEEKLGVMLKPEVHLLGDFS